MPPNVGGALPAGSVPPVGGGGLGLCGGEAFFGCPSDAVGCVVPAFLICSFLSSSDLCFDTPFCCMCSLLILLLAVGLGPSLDPLLCPTGVVLVGGAPGFGGGGRELMDVVRRLGDVAFIAGELMVGFTLLWPGLVVSSLLALIGLGDRAGLGDLVAEMVLEISGLKVLFLITGCFAACGCQPVLREREGGEWVRLTGSLGFSSTRESVLFDLLRYDLTTGGDFLTGTLFEEVVSLLFELGGSSFLFANFLSSLSLGGSTGAGEGDLTAGDVGLDFFLFSR